MASQGLPLKGPIHRSSSVGQGGGAGSVITPWTMEGVVVGLEARIYFRRAAKVNQRVPKIGGVSLVTIPAPYIVVTGTDGQIWVRATHDEAGTITALDLANLTEEPEETETEKFNLVGTWTAADGVFTSVDTLLFYNITLWFCDGTPIWEPAA